MPAETFQQQFHRRWQHLNDPHVRALVWLLDSPNLLNPDAPQWHGKIATLADPSTGAVADWLRDLDRNPASLHQQLAIQPLTRLGRYAEKLMAFYFEHQGILVAHGVQVRAGKNDTVGEFDFLLRQRDALLHWELATKLYLLEPSGSGQAADYFVGPNLADTLGAKMHKILQQQLQLAQHPAAQQYLPQAVALAQALIKGWLFYHDHEMHAVEAIGVSTNHCRGFWCELAEVDKVTASHGVILSRLQWLAPVRIAPDQAMNWPDIKNALTAHFMQDRMPVLVALLERQGDVAIENDRGFIVPNDWRDRAGRRLRRPGVTGI